MDIAAHLLWATMPARLDRGEGGASTDLAEWKLPGMCSWFLSRPGTERLPSKLQITAFLPDNKSLVFCVILVQFAQQLSWVYSEG